jgi:chitinase
LRIFKLIGSFVDVDDLHGGWQNYTGIHGALFRGDLDNTAANVDESVRFLMQEGAERDKLIVGIPAYGIAFTLKDPNNNGVSALTTSGDGHQGYHEICQKVHSGALNYRWEDQQRVPYAFSGTYWIGYDDVRSVTEKAHYINNHGYGGGMFWALDNDDFMNRCGDGRFPLVSTVFKIVVGA